MTNERFRLSRGQLVAGLAMPAVVFAAFAAGRVVNARELSGQTSVTKEEEQSLRSRVAQWWTARQERDHQVMYQLFEPAYRDTTSFAKFLQESSVRSRYDITSHEIVKIETREKDRVVVFVEIGTVLPKFGGPHKVTTEDPWVRVADVWYKVHEPYKPPFPDKPPK